jgi:hypothetical protein
MQLGLTGHALKELIIFFDNAKVTPEKILKPHFENTTHRIYQKMKFFIKKRLITSSLLI